MSVGQRGAEEEEEEEEEYSCFSVVWNNWSQCEFTLSSFVYEACM